MDRLEQRDPLVRRVRLAVSELQVALVLSVLLDLQDLMVHPADSSRLVCLEQRGHQECLVHQDHQDHQDLQEELGSWVLPVKLDQRV